MAKPPKITKSQADLLALLPRMGEEWLHVAMWERRDLNRLDTLHGKGLVDLWRDGLGEQNARLTYDGQCALRAFEPPEESPK